MVAVVAACALTGAFLGSAVTAEVDVLTVEPVLTDSAIDDWFEDHYVFLDRDAPSRGKLLVFLPGSFGLPAGVQEFLTDAAELGLHTIGLRYPNRWTVGTQCAFNLRPDCHEEVRLETIDGTDRTPLIEVNRANSIENRLSKLVAYLDTEFPEDEWGQFLDGTSNPVWSSIVFAGHSQGGGHAALIGRDRAVDRVVLFGAPADYSAVFDRVAFWLSDPKATDVSRYHGFTHIVDDWERHQQTWSALGLDAFGPPADTDTQAVPYAGSHQLSTAKEPALTGAFHSSVVVDAAIPRREDGSPAHAPVWRHLLGGTLFTDGFESGDTFAWQTVRSGLKPDRNRVMPDATDEGEVPMTGSEPVDQHELDHRHRPKSVKRSGWSTNGGLSQSDHA